MMFYDAQRKPSVTPAGEQMANVSLNFSDPGFDPGASLSREFLRNEFPSSSLLVFLFFAEA